MKLKRARVARFVTSALAALAFAAIGVLGVSQPASAASGVSVASYCSVTYAGASPTAVLVSNNAYGWRCRIKWGLFTKDVGVDMNVACKQQRGNSSSAFLLNGDASSPYNWRCT